MRVNEDGLVLPLLALQRVDLGLVVVEREVEFLYLGRAVWHQDLYLEVRLAGVGVAEVHPFHLGGVHGPAMLGRDVREVEWPGCDEEVFLFLRVDPFHDAVRHQVVERPFAGLQPVQIG